MALAEANGKRLRMSELADRTALSASRVTRIVTDLEGRGLIDKRQSPDDGRGYLAVLTRNGWAGSSAPTPTASAALDNTSSIGSTRQASPMWSTRPRTSSDVFSPNARTEPATPRYRSTILAAPPSTYTGLLARHVPGQSQPGSGVLAEQRAAAYVAGHHRRRPMPGLGSTRPRQQR